MHRRSRVVSTSKKEKKNKPNRLCTHTVRRKMCNGVTMDFRLIAWFKLGKTHDEKNAPPCVCVYVYVYVCVCVYMFLRMSLNYFIAEGM